MTLQVQHPVVDWYLAFDDLWELMRVNWHGHNPFTQNGMWQADRYTVKGVAMVIDTSPYRGVLLRVDNDGEDEYVAIATYGGKCNECEYTPYNALWHHGDDSDEALVWGATALVQMIGNAAANGVEVLHNDECSHLTYPDDE